MPNDIKYPSRMSQIPASAFVSCGGEFNENKDWLEQRYTSILSGEAPPDEEDLPEEVIDKQAEDEAAAAAKVSAWENRRKIPKVTMDGAIVGLEPKIQGCLLLQSLAQCPEANEVVLQSYVSYHLFITWNKANE